MTDATNGGLHNRVDYYQAVSSPTISGFAASAYPKTVTNVELFYKNASADVQITNSALTASLGEGMLPGGLLIKGGFGTTPTPVVFATAFPTAAISVVVSSHSTAAQVNLSTYSASGFTATQGGAPSGNISFSWIAIGY